MQKKDETKTHIIKSVKWTTGQSLFNIVYGPIYKIFLALFIGAKGFAYISAFAIILNLGDLLNKIGFSQALIVEKETDYKQFSSVFWIDILMSIIVCSGISLMSTIIESYYQLENLGSMVKILGFCVFASGGVRTFRCYLQKNLKLDVISKIEILQTICDGAFSIVLIITTESIVGYVYGTLISRCLATCLTIISALKNGFKLHFCIQFNLIKKIGGYVRSVTARQIFDYLIQVVDEILIAGMFPDKTILGSYFFAKDLIAKPQSVITAAVSRVALSAVAKVSESKEKVNSMYLTMSRYLATVSFPVFAGIIVTASQFIPTFFGNEYVDAITYMQVFCVGAMLTTITLAPGSAVLFAIKKPNILLKIDLFVNLFYIVLLLLLGKYGVIYVLIATITRLVLSATVTQWCVRRTMQIPLSTYLKKIMWSAIASCGMCIAVLVLRQLLWYVQCNHNILGLLLSIFIGVFMYVGTIWKMDKSILNEILSIIRKK